MNPKTTARTLSSEELDMLLHLPVAAEGDPQPVEELSALRFALDDLRAASSAAAIHHRQRASLVPAHASTSRRVWTFAAATTLLLCVAAPLSFHHSPTTAPVVTAVSQTQAPAVSDEVLFANVQSDIDASVPSPMLPLTTDTNTTQSPSKGTAQ